MRGGKHRMARLFKKKINKHCGLLVPSINSNEYWSPGESLKKNYNYSKVET